MCVSQDTSICECGRMIFLFLKSIYSQNTTEWQAHIFLAVPKNKSPGGMVIRLKAAIPMNNGPFAAQRLEKQNFIGCQQDAFLQEKLLSREEANHPRLSARSQQPRLPSPHLLCCSKSGGRSDWSVSMKAKGHPRALAGKVKPNQTSGGYILSFNRISLSDTPQPCGYT